MGRAAFGLLLLPGLLTLALLAACLAAPPGDTAVPDPPVPAEQDAAGPSPRPWPPPRPLAAEPAPASPMTDAWPPVARALENRCHPCHFPGGEMYERMPFDDPVTVRAHGPGIGKRLEGDELAALQVLLAEQGRAPH